MPSVFYLDCNFSVDDLELDLEDQDMSFGIDFGVVTERDLIITSGATLVRGD